MTLTRDAINTPGVAAFEARLGHRCEHAPWAAWRAAASRRFASRDDLHRAFLPAIAGDLTADSRREQSGAGRDRLTAEEYQRFHALNGPDTEKFGFPFILAVKGKTKDQILASFETRLRNDPGGRAPGCPRSGRADRRLSARRYRGRVRRR